METTCADEVTSTASPATFSIRLLMLSAIMDCCSAALKISLVIAVISETERDIARKDLPAVAAESTTLTAALYSYTCGKSQSII